MIKAIETSTRWPEKDGALQKTVCSLVVGAMSIAVALAQDIDLNRGLTAWYPFNGNANDATTNGLHGTVSGASLTTDRFGAPDSAYYFDGLASQIDVFGTEALHFTNGGFTLSAWVRVDEDVPLPSYGRLIVGKHYRGTPLGYYLAFGWEQDRLGFAIGSWLYVPANPIDSQWHHVVGTYDDTNQVVYLDAFMANSRTNVPPIECTAYIVIGNTPSGPAHFKGKIDDVRIYNRALNAAEVAQLFSVESPPISPQIVQQPVSLLVWQGTAATNTVVAAGTAPLAYQWRKNGSPLSGFTNSSLLFLNTTTNNTGGYDVIVSNALGSVTSLVAQLTVLAPGRLTRPSYSPGMGFSFIFCDATIGWPYRIQVSSALTQGSWVDWFSFTYNGRIGLLDLDATGAERRFYRAVSP